MTETYSSISSCLRTAKGAGIPDANFSIEESLTMGLHRPPRSPAGAGHLRLLRGHQPLTPNRAAASRCVAPAATAASTRVRRSTESAFDMSAGLPPGRQLDDVDAPATDRRHRVGWRR
jgi:hypothetical protein